MPITLYLSYMAWYPIFSHWFYHLCVIINYSAKNIKNLCVRSIQNLPFCVSIHIHLVDIASWGTPSPIVLFITLGTQYAVGRSVRK